MKELYGQAVGVADMMASRDARAARQAVWLATYTMPLVSLTMNIAGPVKVTRRVAEGFSLAVEQVDAQLARFGWETAAFERVEAATGLEALWAVRTNVDSLKRRMADIEEAGRFGRLLDLDVIGLDGVKVSREAIGLPPRRCLLCEQEAAACARSRAHTVEALRNETERILTAALHGRFVERIAGLAQQALLYEVAVTPKPGLVDRANNGAHSDMDFLTFMQSAAVLTPYWQACVEVGLSARSAGEAFASLRYPGMCAETEMLAATGGINTHKGAIFSLGILCGASGIAKARDARLDAETLCAISAEMTADALREEMQVIDGPKGARGEAASGFASVRQYGLPALEARLAAGDSLNDAGVYTLVALVASVLDANVARRADEARARSLIVEAQALMRAYDMEKVRMLDAQLIAENISPGGCADLLAVTLFLHFLAACS